MIRKERIASFDPFKRRFFWCPVCGGNDFVELYPYGGVWCSTCNAHFSVRGTCDGIRKVAVDCFTEHVWEKREDLLEYYWAVIWEHDKRMTWHAVKEQNGKKSLVTIDAQPH